MLSCESQRNRAAHVVAAPAAKKSSSSSSRSDNQQADVENAAEARDGVDGPAAAAVAAAAELDGENEVEVGLFIERVKRASE